MESAHYAADLWNGVFSRYRPAASRLTCNAVHDEMTVEIQVSAETALIEVWCYPDQVIVGLGGVAYNLLDVETSEVPVVTPVLNELDMMLQGTLWSYQVSRDGTLRFAGVRSGSVAAWLSELSGREADTSQVLIRRCNEVEQFYSCNAGRVAIIHHVAERERMVSIMAGMKRTEHRCIQVGQRELVYQYPTDSAWDKVLRV